MTERAAISAEEALKHTEWVGRLARALAGNPEDAADLGQEAWEAVLTSSDPPQSEVRAWLTGVLRNLSAMGARTNARRLRREAAAVRPEPSLAPDELIERIETQQLVAKLVLELDEPVRLVLFLRYYEGLSATEIGERLGTPAGTVRWRLKTGVDELRERLDQSFEGDRHRWMSLIVPALALPPAASARFLKGALIMKANKILVATLGTLLSLLLLGTWWGWPQGEPEPSPPPLSRSSPRAAQGTGQTDPRRPPDLAASSGGQGALPRWLAQPDAPPRRVAGRVVLAGELVEGALVRLESRQGSFGLRAQELRTSRDGAFDFGEQLAVAVTVSASSPGVTGALVTVDLRDPSATPAPESLELVLTDCSARLFGHVLDSSGGSIEKARVRRANGGGVETNALGEYELCLPQGENTLHVDADGYGAVRLKLLALGRTARDLVLTPEAFIVGRVIAHETGAPVAGALVTAYPAQYTDGDSVLGGVVFSGAEGRFRLPAAPGDYRVIASSADASSPSPVLVSAIVGRLSDELVLRLWERAELRGHVRSGGKPVPGAQVTAIATLGGIRANGFSQRDGSFVIPGVRKGEVAFSAEPFAVVSPRRFVVAKSQERVELEVLRQGSLRGLVTREGKPVVNANVEVSAGLASFNARSDAAGRYLVMGLPAARYRVLATSVTAGGFVDQPGVTLADQEDRTLDLELSSAASIAGRVVSADGTPVPGALVVYNHTQTGDEGLSVADADGRFLCNQMTGGGEYQPKVYASASSRAPYKPAGPPFPKATLADGNSHVEGVTLAIHFEQLSIRGRVVTPDGTPVPDVRVRVQATQPGEPPRFTAWMALPTAISDAQGGFTVDALTSGSWALEARSPDGAETIVPDLAAGARNVVVTLLPPSGIDGTLVGYEEPPVIYARPIDASRLIPGQVSGSRFHLTLPVGTYVISAMNTREGDVQRVDVRAGAELKVTMTSSGSAVVTGSVVEHVTRMPVPDLVCHVVVALGGMPGFTNWDLESAPKTDATGAFSADPSPAGDLHVVCMGDFREYSMASALLTVAQGGRATVALEIVRRLSPDRPGDIGVTFTQAPTPLITAVKPGSPAAQAGVTAGDLVVAVDGVATGPLDATGVEALIGNHPPGTRVGLTLLRGNQRRELTLATTPKP